MNDISASKGGNYLGNFDLFEAMRLFSFNNLIYDSHEMAKEAQLYERFGVNETPTTNKTDFGGVYVITSKQIILAYNSNLGTGDHYPTMSRIMKEMNGGGLITTSMEMQKLHSLIVNQRGYLTGRITYEKTAGGFYGTIQFHIPPRISPAMFEAFKQFYFEHNEEIKSAVNRAAMHNGTFKVFVVIKETREKFYDDNLDRVYSELEKRVDPSLEDDNYDEVIIGEKIDQQQI